MVRAAVKPGKQEGTVTVFGPQCEVEAYSKQRFWTGGIYGQGAGGWIYPLWLEAHADTRDAMNPQGEWNRITVQAEGETIKTWLNGKPAASWKTSEYTEGFFGLQIHSGKQGTIHFRNILVKEG
ncbi:MAG: family 16 glycoside hydrolase, partial [Verrucomicrobiota bacterium]